MAAVSPPAETSTVSSSTNVPGDLRMEEFWRAGLEYIARGVIAYQSAAQQTRLADAYLSRHNTNSVVAAAAHQAKEQVHPHKECFEACVRALSDLAPSGLPIASASNEPAQLSARITTLEAQVERLTETVERTPASLDDVTARIESGCKASEDGLSRAIARVEKSHEQLEGRVTLLSNQVAESDVVDLRASVTAQNNAVESRIVALETKVKKRTGVNDFQEQLKGQSSRIEGLETELKDVKNQTQDVSDSVQPLLPLAPQVDSMLSAHAQVESIGTELVDLQEKSESNRAEIDSLKNASESMSKSLEAIKLNTFDSFISNVASIFPMKEHTATLKTLSGTVDGLQNTISCLFPLQDRIQSLERLSTKSTSLLAVVSEREQLTQDIKQLQDDVTRHSRDMPQVQSTTLALKQQIQGLGDLQTEVRGLMEKLKTAKETSSSIRTLEEQVANLNASGQPTKQDVVEIERRLTHLESGENDRQAHDATVLAIQDRIAVLETNSAVVENVKKRIAVFHPLRKHVPDLLALATQSASLSSLVSIHKTTSEDIERLRTNVDRSSEEGRLRLVELERKALGLGTTHPIDEEFRSIQEAIDTLRPLSQKFEILSSTTQDAIDTLAQTTNRVSSLGDDLIFIHDRIDDVSEGVSSLDPLKELAEGLVLLANRAELLVSLPEQFTAVSGDVGNLRADWAKRTQKTARVNKQLDQREVDRAEHTASVTESEDHTEKEFHGFVELQRRLDALEKDTKSLKSKASKVSTKMNELEHTLDLGEVRSKRTSEMNDLVTLLPLTNNVEALLSLVDQTTPSTLPAQMSQKVDSEQPNTSNGQTQPAEQPVPPISELDPQDSKSDKQLAMLTARYEILNTELGSVSKLQERVLQLEIGSQILQVKLDNYDEAVKLEGEEAKELKGEVVKVQALADNTLRKISDMSTLLPFVDELVALSSKADELLAFVDQAVPIAERLSQLSKGQSSMVGRFEKLKDSMEALDNSVTAFDLKNSGQETVIKAIEQDSQEQKEDRNWCKRELRRLAAEVNELAPLKRHGAASLTAASPLSPGSPLQHDSQPYEARISLLEKLAASAKKELVNIAGALLRLEAARNNLKPLLPLSDHVQGLLALLNRGEDVPPSDFMKRVSELEAKESSRVEHIDMIESLKALLPLVGQTDALVTFAGRFNTYEQLVGQVNGLLPLAAHISELQASTQSINEFLPLMEKLAASDCANSNVQPQPSAPSQLRSPPSERHSSHPISFSQALQATPTSLMPAPNITPSPGRPSKKRRLEAAVESLEVQIDSMRNEIDDVAWNVRILDEQRVGSKRLRDQENELVHTKAVQGSDGVPAVGRNHSRAKLNAAVREVFAGIWQDGDGWLEKLDMELGRLWAEKLKAGEIENAGMVVARVLGEVREDIDTLRLAIEARGPGMVAANTSNTVGMEKAAQQLIKHMLAEQSQFKDQLKEWLDETMKPVTNMFAAMQGAQARLG